jgi:hypothetical protein
MISEIATTVWFFIKQKALYYIPVLLLWTTPIHLTIVLILIAIAADTLAGRWCAKHMAKKEGKDVRLEVTSKKTRIGFVSKSITYFTLLILTFFGDNIIFNDLLLYFIPNFPIEYFISKGLGIIFLLIEFDSLDEKYYKVKGVKLRDIIGKKIKQVKNLIIGAKEFKDEIKK